MLRTSKKFIALLLAAWLPLFSGNALAMHATMLNDSGECQTATKQQDHSSHQSQHEAPQDQSTPHHSQQNSGCNNCGVCHFACSGFVSAATVAVASFQPGSPPYPLLATPFLSFISFPLDPPPRA